MLSFSLQTNDDDNNNNNNNNNNYIRYNFIDNVNVSYQLLINILKLSDRIIRDIFISST